MAPFDFRSDGRFQLGKIVIAERASATLSDAEVFRALRRHVVGDWGDLDAHDRKCNNEALKIGERLISVYTTAAGVRFYVITEWDRSVTTVLLPSEY